MPFCPNLECPHRKRLGEPAEYVIGTIKCSDCGTPLSEDAPSFEPASAPESKKVKIVITDFWKRLSITFALLFFWNILSHTPIPGINQEALYKAFQEHDSLRPQMSLFALGLLPYIYSYVVLELLALFLPPLKAWRSNGAFGRAKLTQVARWLTLLVVIAYGYSIAQDLEQFSYAHIFYEPGLTYRIIVVSTLAVGTFISLWIADMITTRGIGHGISILLLAGYMHNLPRKAYDLVKYYQGATPVRDLLGVAFVALILITLVVIVEKAYQKIDIKFSDGTKGYLPLKLTTAGITPMDPIAAQVMYPVMLILYFIQEIVLIDWSPGKPAFYLYYIFLITCSYYILSFFFYRPKGIINYVKKINAEFVDEDVKEIRRKRNIMAFFGSLYLCFFALLADISFRTAEAPLYGMAFIVSTVVALDVLAEIRLRFHSGKLVKITEFQKPMEAGLFKSLLRQQKIPCLLQGYYHRALLYFFGPYIEISIYVPEDKADDAYSLLKKYLESNEPERQAQR